MSIRLNNDMRDEITNAVILHKFEQEARELCDEHAAIALEIYDDVYADDRKAMNDLPDGWLPEAVDITVNSGGERHTFRFDGSTQRYGRAAGHWVLREIKRDENNKRVKSVDNCYKATKAYPTRSPITKRIDKYQQMLGKFNERTGDAQRQTRAMLDKFYTVEKLLEAWPEIKPFIPEKQRPVQLPAVPTKALNEMLDLPVGDE